MGDLANLQMIGAALFGVLAIGLMAIQTECLARYRWAIFLGCLSCFVGAALVGYLTYAPLPHSVATLYEEVASNGGSSSIFGGGQPRGGSSKKAGAGGSGGKLSSARGNGSAGGAGAGGNAGSGADDSAQGGNFPPRSSSGTFTDCPKCPVMTIIPTGEFDLPVEGDGSLASSSTVRRIRMTRSFAVSKFEIKLDEFELFARETKFQPSAACHTDGIGGKSASYLKTGMEQTRHHPVVCISFNDALLYVAWLSKRASLPYRLLSEVEWEYVRRGSKELSSGGTHGSPPLNDDGNIRWDEWVAETTPVGRYRANRFDVHDMMGNAAEWTADCWHDDLRAAPANARARISSGDCAFHAARGGSWDHNAKKSDASSRYKVPANTRDWRIGFRIMRPASDQRIASN